MHKFTSPRPSPPEKRQARSGSAPVSHSADVKHCLPDLSGGHASHAFGHSVSSSACSAAVYAALSASCCL